MTMPLAPWSTAALTRRPSAPPYMATISTYGAESLFRAMCWRRSGALAKITRSKSTNPRKPKSPDLKGCISLSADQDNGFFRVDRQVEPPRCFLQRVRAMRDDYPRNLWSGERCGDFLRERDPPGRVHIVGRHV